MSTTTEELTPLKVSDRCDTRDCNAQARVRLWIAIPQVFADEELKPLDFCGHHFAKAQPAPDCIIATMEDNRE